MSPPRPMPPKEKIPHIQTFHVKVTLMDGSIRSHKEMRSGELPLWPVHLRDFEGGEWVGWLIANVFYHKDVVAIVEVEALL